MKVTDGEDCDRLTALSDSWLLRASGGGGSRWCHRELSDDRVATTTVPAHHDVDGHHRPSSSSTSRHRPVLADDRRDSSTSDSKRGGGSSSSRASPVIITKDSSSCGEMSSHRDHSLDVTTDFCRASAERFSLRGARNALRRGVDNLIGRRTPPSRKHHPQHQMNGGGGQLEIGDPVPVTSEAFERKMERLGCVDLLNVEQVDGAVRQTRSSDSLVPCRREASPARLSVQLDSVRVTPGHDESSSKNVAPTSDDDWSKYFQSCFSDAFDDRHLPAALPTVVTTCADDCSLSVRRQTELDQILDEIVRDIDLLDRTLADNSGQLHRAADLLLKLIYVLQFYEYVNNQQLYGITVCHVVFSFAVECTALQRSTHSEERTSPSSGAGGGGLYDADEQRFQLDVDSHCDAVIAGRDSEQLTAVGLTTTNGVASSSSSSERRDSGVGFSLTRPTR